MGRSGQLRAAVMSLVIAGSAIVGGAAVTQAGAMPPEPPGECPALLPVAQVAKGMEGTGWTVVRGDEPQPFAVEVLGLVPDGVAPGKPMILVEVSDLPGSSFIEEAGGIWSGMSGSPVYDNVSGRLIGAVAFGFTLAPSPIGGLTPAISMSRVLDMPGAGANAVPRGKVALPDGLRRIVARRLGRPVSASIGLSRLAVPLTVSGLRGRMRDRFERQLARREGSWLLVVGSRARRGVGVPAGRPVPGGNFAAVISYGDVTVGGIGTTTYVCGYRALAFGHPLDFVGRASYGANDADALAIVKDATFGSFKLANIGRSVGTVDQDRLSAIRADLTETPDVIPVTAHIEDLDLGLVRDGRSDVTMSDWVPLIAPVHLFAGWDAMSERIGPGTAELEFLIRGRRPDGRTWALSRTDRVSSRGDVSLEAAFAIDEILFRLSRNPLEPVTFTSVAMKARVIDRYAAVEITGVQVSRQGARFRSVRRLELRPGEPIELRVLLRRFGGAEERARMSIAVPRGFTGSGDLIVQGGADAFSACDFDPSECPRATFGRILKELQTAPRNDEIIASFALVDENFEAVEGPTERVQRQTVVSGEVRIPVVVTP